MRNESEILYMKTKKKKDKEITDMTKVWDP